jgi:hypothetical protein
MVVRRLVPVSVALVALAIAFIAGTGAAADATQGQAVIAGQNNSETSETIIVNQGAGTGMSVYGSGDANGVYGSGYFGIHGFGTQAGVVGEAASGGNGVFGATSSNTASGVYGQNNGTGYGVAGRANLSGGTGVLAESTDGTALVVNGKAQFSRSGVATVTGTSTTPKNSVKVTLPVTAKSMVFATLQKRVAGVYVVAAVPNVAGGYFTIYLNKSVATSVGPIAWQVIERP